MHVGGALHGYQGWTWGFGVHVRGVATMFDSYP